MTKMIAAVGTLILIIVTGGLYLFMRSKDNKASDWQKIRERATSVYTKAVSPFRAANNCIRTLFAAKDEKAAA